MAAHTRSEKELEDIAMQLLDNLRSEHLTVGQLKAVAGHMINLTEFIVLREKPNEED